MNLSPTPIQKFFTNNGAPAAGWQLFTYAAGTSEKLATFNDQSGNEQNTNPIVLDFRGECRLWLNPNLTYKYVLAPPEDTDPPTNPTWSVDDISAPDAGGASGGVPLAMTFEMADESTFQSDGQEFGDLVEGTTYLSSDDVSFEEDGGARLVFHTVGTYRVTITSQVGPDSVNWPSGAGMQIQWLAGGNLASRIVNPDPTNADGDPAMWSFEVLVQATEVDTQLTLRVSADLMAELEAIDMTVSGLLTAQRISS